MKNKIQMTDQEAMDDIAQWMIDVDPTLTGNLPDWVWDLVSLLDDVIEYTGRNDFQRNQNWS
jgi:hypothetical protein